MASYTRLFVHLVWATKLRTPWIAPDLAPRLHGVLAARCHALDCLALAVGGVEDHVHALVGLHPTVDVARLARELKAPTAGFARRVLGIDSFAWQEGYGAFTLRDTELETVRRYVLDQPNHHAAGTLVADWERVTAPDPPAP